MANNKHILFVFGPAESGRSKYIEKHYGTYIKVDLALFQTEEGANEDSFNRCLEAFKEAINNHDRVVLEHTLPKIKHRVPYIAAAEAIGCMPEAVVMLPRERHWDNYATVKRLENYYGIFESPCIKDGFSNVTTICD